ncbi:MAG: glycosyltransferase [Actinomycetota bacterium]|nr:glycosyltransferase [Actinomycetota bacterium]MDA8358193.1 glycosyltransferase [Actinomycetota bacterium]
MIPRVAHFVFGLREQAEPFHFLHYASIESCRRMIEPETIYFHYKHLPWGPWWERIRPELTLDEVDLVPEVTSADYSPGLVPEAYRYAHHSDFIRLDALLAHGGIYADIDTIFVRPFPDELFSAPFVIGREPEVRDEFTGELRPSLCNALLMSEPGGQFAQAWRDKIAGALNGSWSNHSGFLSAELSRRMPAEVHVVAEETFFPFSSSAAGLSALLEQRHGVPAESVSVHLWAHLWWERRRRDLSSVHAARYVPSYVRSAPTTLAELTRPFLPDRTPARRAGTATRWTYLSLDEASGYGVAADRCIAALEEEGVDLTWSPFAVGGGWGLGYEPVSLPDPSDGHEVVVAHLVAEYLPAVHSHFPDAFVVAHTVWDTTKIPDHWVGPLDQVDLVVVPSRFSADAVAAAAVKTPVAIVPHVAPPPLRAGSGAFLDVPDDFVVFYTVAEWNERKAVFLTIEAYLRAFTRHDRVLLVVKTSQRDRRVARSAGGAAGEGTTAWSVAKLLSAHADPPRVALITRELADEEIAAIHRRGDCFVSLARGEGWGLGAFDAAAHRRPVVTTGFGGQLDYLVGTPYLVGFELVPVDDPIGFPSYAPDQRWAEPDLDHAAALLREVAADPYGAREIADCLATEIHKRYRPSAVAQTFLTAVERHEAARRRRVAQAPRAGGQ